MRLLLSRRAALAIWALTLLAISIGITFGKPGKLYRTFAAAGEHFRNGEPLYIRVIDEHGPDGQPVYGLVMSEKLDLYRYTPLIAASFVPWSLLPEHLGAVLWRCFQAVVLLLALRAWAKIAMPPVPWPALAILALPLSAGNFHNAQVNPLVAAMMVLAVVAFWYDRYWLSAAAIAIATAYKVYPISLGLLLCVLEPKKYTWRMLVLVAIGFVLPFGLQSPTYVLQEYKGLELILKLDDRTNQPMYEGYFDFHKLLTLYGMPIPLMAYRGIEVVAGCAAAAFIFWGKRQGWSRARQLHACLGLGLLWCTLFGPSTESATYMLLAPLIAQSAIAVANRSLWERIVVWGVYAILIASQIVVWFPHPIADPIRGTLLPQPHAALVLLIWFIWRMQRDGELAPRPFAQSGSP